MRFLSWPCLLPPGETDWKANVNQLVAVWCSSSSSRASRMCNDVQCAFSIIYARASFPSSSSCLFQLVLEPLFLRKCTLCNRNTYNGDWRCQCSNYVMGQGVFRDRPFQRFWNLSGNVFSSTLKISKKPLCTLAPFTRIGYPISRSEEINLRLKIDTDVPPQNEWLKFVQLCQRGR